MSRKLDSLWENVTNYGLVSGDGELTLGSINASLYTGNIAYASLSTTKYWGLTVPS